MGRLAPLGPGSNTAFRANIQPQSQQLSTELPREPWRLLREVGFYDHWEQALWALSFSGCSSSCSCGLPGDDGNHLRPNSDADARESVTDADSQFITYAYAHADSNTHADSYTHADAHSSSDPADQH